MIDTRSQGSDIKRAIIDCLPPERLLGSNQTVVLFGGTFDPPQIAHQQLSTALADRFGIVIVLPTAKNPLKANGPIASDQDRLNMLGRMMAGDERVKVCSYDIDRVVSGGGESFTYQLIRDAKAQLPPGARIILPIGTDCLAEFNRWKNYTEILAESIVTPINRKGFPVNWSEIESKLGRDVTEILKGRMIDLDLPQASSTQVREAIRSGGDINDLVVPAVRCYITENSLYGARVSA